MSEYLVYDVLVFNATVRRIDNDPDCTPAKTADLKIDVEDAFQWCVTRHCAQVRPLQWAYGANHDGLAPLLRAGGYPIGGWNWPGCRRHLSRWPADG